MGYLMGLSRTEEKSPVRLYRERKQCLRRKPLGYFAYVGGHQSDYPFMVC